MAEEEPLISVKPFVKDWVLKHCDSVNSSPSKRSNPDSLSLADVSVSSGSVC